MDSGTPVDSGKCLFDRAFFRDFDVKPVFPLKGSRVGFLVQDPFGFLHCLLLCLCRTLLLIVTHFRLKLFLLQPFLIIIVPPLSIQIFVEEAIEELLRKRCIILMSMITLPTLLTL